MIHTPTFETARLILRQPTEADLPNWQKHFAKWEIIGPLFQQVPWPYPDDGVSYFWFNTVLPQLGTSRWLWGIFLKSNPQELVGCVDLKKDAADSRGFWLATEHWGQGYMTEAVTPITDFAFNTLGFEQLNLCNALGNKRSRRIKEKQGATLLKVAPTAHNDPALCPYPVGALGTHQKSLAKPPTLNVFSKPISTRWCSTYMLHQRRWACGNNRTYSACFIGHRGVYTGDYFDLDFFFIV